MRKLIQRYVGLNHRVVRGQSKTGTLGNTEVGRLTCPPQLGDPGWLCPLLLTGWQLPGPSAAESPPKLWFLTHCRL